MRAQDGPRPGRSGSEDVEVWLRRGAAVVVASVAAYASYVHQRAFALQGGADGTSAALWPFSVDGLLLLATAGLLKPASDPSRRSRLVVWLAFLFGIGVSLAANIAAAPTLDWKPVLVAGWPPVSLLLSVELLARRSARRERGESAGRGSSGSSRFGTRVKVIAASAAADRPDSPDGQDHTRPSRPRSSPARSDQSAEDVMWAYFQEQLAAGRTPTGAELDRVANTNNYGRAVLARWRSNGRIQAVLQGVDASSG